LLALETMPKKSPSFEQVFNRLRDLLTKQADGLSVERDTAEYYGLKAPTGPATVKVWGGKMKSPMIPVAWVQVGKAYVSFHLMGVYGNPKLLDGVSEQLLARMQGKSCFNFKAVDEELFGELETLTARSIQGMKQAGFVAEGPAG
jgi:hypothetical protein